MSHSCAVILCVILLKLSDFCFVCQIYFKIWQVRRLILEDTSSGITGILLTDLEIIEDHVRVNVDFFFL